VANKKTEIKIDERYTIESYPSGKFTVQIGKGWLKKIFIGFKEQMYKIETYFSVVEFFSNISDAKKAIELHREQKFKIGVKETKINKYVIEEYPKNNMFAVKIGKGWLKKDYDTGMYEIESYFPCADFFGSIDDAKKYIDMYESQK